MRPVRRAAVAIAGAVALAAPVSLAAAPTAPAELVPQAPAPDPLAIRSSALDAAAAWRDTLGAHRAPPLPTPGDTAAVILVLRGPPAAAADPGGRAVAAAQISEQQAALEPVLASLGATVTFRYRVLLDAVAVSVPASRVEALAALSEVAAVVPVGFLAPAQVAAAGPEPVSGASVAAPAVAGPGPAHIALIDAGVDASHPWLGGGMGPTFPIIGGADLVDGDVDPSPGEPDPSAEAHGTQMASLVLRSPALAGLAPAQLPRLLVYRVVAQEPVAGRLQPLARTDRVLAALEQAVDPNLDGDPSDRAEVILLGLAGAFDGGGVDPVSDALEAADRVGATVVAPAGNDGPTFARPGSVGGPAVARTVLAVGGASAGVSPRTADLEARLGPASARLDGLPLMGPDPAGGGWPVVALRDDAGVSAGGSDKDFQAADGTSRALGALVLVARGDAPIAETARRAAAAGARALAIWDEDGVAGFPAVPGDSGLPLPVVGLGARQGAALMRLAETESGLRVSLRAQPVTATPVTVASFSSWGPTVDGRQKPDLVAPAVARPAAWPGPAVDGSAQTAPLTGTSAAAAEVAALALRFRVDQPGLGPAAVRSLLVQAARPLAGLAAGPQGAGLAAAPRLRALRIEPAIVAAEASRDGARAEVVLRDLGGRRADYSVWLRSGGSETLVAEGVSVGADGRRRLSLDLPAARGRLVLRTAAGDEAAGAPVLPSRPARTGPAALGEPEVRADARLAEARVRVGVLRQEDGRLRSVRLHGLRIVLVPVGGGAPLPVSGAKQGAAWPAGTYRFLITPRLATGLDVPAGRYRLRVSGVGPEGERLRTESGPFPLG
jgi:hypothetical protein